MFGRRKLKARIAELEREVQLLKDVHSGSKDVIASMKRAVSEAQKHLEKVCPQPSSWTCTTNITP